MVGEGMRRAASVACLAWLFALPGLAGCGSVTTAAREQFVSAFTCPEDRVTVTERSDLLAHDFKARPAPPPEIASDPGRLAVWSELEASSYASDDHRAGEIYEVRGCDTVAFFACHPAAPFRSWPQRSTVNASCTKLGPIQQPH